MLKTQLKQTCEFGLWGKGGKIYTQHYYNYDNDDKIDGGDENNDGGSTYDDIRDLKQRGQRRRRQRTIVNTITARWNTSSWASARSCC